MFLSVLLQAARVCSGMSSAAPGDRHILLFGVESVVRLELLNLPGNTIFSKIIKITTTTVLFCLHCKKYNQPTKKTPKTVWPICTCIFGNLVWKPPHLVAGWHQQMLQPSYEVCLPFQEFSSGVSNTKGSMGLFLLCLVMLEVCSFWANGETTASELHK